MATESESLSQGIREALAPAYRVDRLLGVGGMATVYLAYDLKHERQVAIKILRPELAATVGAARFIREIRVAARLTHPNILPLLDSGAVGDTPYYVMPFVEGESLRARLDRDGRIPLGDAVALIAESADALNYAHAAGIVHRDIKPENILLLSGHAMIADFGIARAVTASAGDENVTTAGLVLGTPTYMSPEQAAGEEQVDGRSDIYSLATVLFEMVTGAVPFHGKTAQALIARRFVQTPPRLSTLRPDIPPNIDAAVAAALALEAADRPATAGDFVKLLVGAGTTAAYTLGSAGSSTAALTRSDAKPPSIAVLPFANLTSDPENEFLSDGLTEEIMNALSRLRTLRVAARTSSFAFKGRRDDVRAIATKLGVGAILDGSVRRAGARVRVSAQLIDATTGFEVWSDQYDRHLDDAFAIQADIARAIASALRATLFDANATAPTVAVSGLVYETYLRGRYALNKRTEADLTRAVTYFETAAAESPDFALASAGLADALLVLGIYGVQRPADVLPAARTAAERALAIDPSLPEAYATLGAVRALFDWNWEGAEDAFRRAIALGPRYSTALHWFAVNHLLPQGRFDEARSTIERARALDPLSMVIATSVGVIQHLSGDATGAVHTLRHALELDATFVMSHYFLGGALRDAGDMQGSAAAFRAAITQSGGTPEMVAGLAQTLAKQGDPAGARALQQTLHQTAERRHVSACLLAQVHAALGETDDALAALERAREDHEPDLVFIGLRTVYGPLHGAERFATLRKEIGV